MNDTSFILIRYYEFVGICNPISVDSGSNTFFIKKGLKLMNTLGQVSNGFSIQLNFYTIQAFSRIQERCRWAS